MNTRRDVVSHLALVRAVASHYQGLGLPFEDLVQEGSVGLLEAIDRYDPGRHTSFEAFARFRVRRAIRNALTEQARLVRLPKQIVERRRAIDRAEARFAAAHGRAPTPDELASAAALPLAAVLDARSAAIVPLSLDDRATDDGATLESVVADATASDPERDAIAADAAQRLRTVVAQLPRRQREIVSRHFGLDGSEEPIAAVAADLHLSERRTRAIEQDALYRLQTDLQCVPETRRSRP